VEQEEPEVQEAPEEPEAPEEREEPEKPEESEAATETETVEQGAVESEEPGFLQRVAEARRARREEREAKRAAREKEAAERRAAREKEAAEKKAAREKEAAERKATRERKAAEKQAKREDERQSKQAELEAEKASPAPEKPSKPKARDKSSGLDVNQATFEQLRGLGLSVTQATRVIAYRERKDGFASVDDLDSVPGLPKDMLDDLKEKLTV
jgi:DNA uptake protein ComE-like DNA-binding protein